MSRAIEIQSLTKALVAIPSVNESRRQEDGIFSETVVAEYIHRWFSERNIPSFLQDLPDGRKNVFAYVPGQTDKTVLLAGHFDTVGVGEYEALGLHPFDPDKLADEQNIHDGHMPGRGTLDMKSGIANAMVLMEKWLLQNEELPGSALFVATCDEENNSYGILNAVDILLGLKEGDFADPDLEKQVKQLVPQGKLNLLGIINMDYTTKRHPDDKSYHVWHGTIGKLLPSILVRGKETHAGEHFNGFHASSLMARLITAIEGNMDFAQQNVPPTVLKITDGRSNYTVMTASTEKAYLNMFTVGTTPEDILKQIEKTSQRAIGELASTIEVNYKSYCQRMGIPYEQKAWQEKVTVLRYSQLVDRYKKTFGNEAFKQVVTNSVENSNTDDIREKSFAVVEKLMNELQIKDPTVVLFYSPPFYPYVKPDTDGVYKATENGRREIEQKYDVKIDSHGFYPYISDMSYVQLDPAIAESIHGLTDEMPAWGNGYWFDLDKIQRLNLPMVNIGPYGLGAHQTNEALETRYTFEILPDLINNVVVRLWNEK